MDLRRSARTTRSLSTMTSKYFSAAPTVDGALAKREPVESSTGLADRVKLRLRTPSAVVQPEQTTAAIDSDSSVLTPPQTLSSRARKHVEIAVEKSEAPSLPSPRKKARTRTTSTGSSVAAPATAPVGWETTYDLIKRYRATTIAPVDTMGCERLAEAGENVDPKVGETLTSIYHATQTTRFQTLVSLMLSSQTKDQVTAAAIANLRARLPGGLTLKSVLECDANLLQSCICKVGFHSRKTDYIKQAARICQEQHGGDIPDTIEGLMGLPGVGPKMDRMSMWAIAGSSLINAGIGVDVHVHRITNRLGWCDTEKGGPEATRKALESWLLPTHWQAINPLLVGFGQTTCLPRGPRCEECPVRQRCPSARKYIKLKRVKREIKVEEGIVKVEVKEEAMVKREVEEEKEEAAEAEAEAIVKEEIEW
ncbi:putative DNA repair protein NTG1 [Jimgerdemannia flammicorona]|uniref:Endonuclease III homolog n=1 Tax=Jimgerdemannia flammicorona TaxID=994334 RepID=A0A433D6N7_9FUNG|nr:putative DNA repair protein NTG1 [Jimgerdemannia flammicorona]